MYRLLLQLRLKRFQALVRLGYRVRYALLAPQPFHRRTER